MKQFKILHKDGNARAGILTTPHGVIETPNFNPVGTQATVKALGPRELKEIGVQMVLAKLIHLEGGSIATPVLYGVVHGGTHKDLRIRSAKFTDKNFDAIAIGGIYWV